MAESVKKHCETNTNLWQRNPNAPEDDDAIQYKYFEEKQMDKTLSVSTSAVKGKAKANASGAKHLIGAMAAVGKALQPVHAPAMLGALQPPEAAPAAEAAAAAKAGTASVPLPSVSAANLQGPPAPLGPGPQFDMSDPVQAKAAVCLAKMQARALEKAVKAAAKAEKSKAKAATREQEKRAATEEAQRIKDLPQTKASKWASGLSTAELLNRFTVR